MMNKYEKVLKELYSIWNVESEKCTCHPKYKGGKCNNNCEHKQALQELIDKESKYQALEEELGISLPILFKAIKTNIWNNNTKRQEWVILDYSNNEFVLKTTKELYIDDSKCVLLLKDYKKTWALCREDLKSE